jgi:hypothetical protein
LKYRRLTTTIASGTAIRSWPVPHRIPRHPVTTIATTEVVGASSGSAWEVAGSPNRLMSPSGQ